MAEMRDTLGKTLFLGGFNLVAVILLFAFFSSEPSSDDAMLFASGEWAPYSGEDLPQQGVATAIIRTVIQNMGYQANFRFMPWPQAESATRSAEDSEETRATFPYIKVASREKHFYFSVPILDVENSFYFNPNAIDPELFAASEISWSLDDPPDLSQLEHELPADVIAEIKKYGDEQKQELAIASSANLTTEQENQQLMKISNQRLNRIINARLTLQRHKMQIIKIEGYENSGIFTGLMAPDHEAVKTNKEAFTLLMHSDQPLILIEASSVARQLLREQFPQNYLDIFGDNDDLSPPAHNLQKAPITLNIPVHLMAGKGNPENLRFISRFNETYLRLKNDGVIDSIENSVLKSLDEGQLVRLYPMTPDGYIKGYLANPKFSPANTTDYVLLNRGTKAIVLAWSPGFLFTLSEANPTPEPVKIKITQGPHSGRELYIDGRSIELP